MKNNTAKQNAKSFQREFSIYSITYPALKEAVEKQGYTVVEFNHIYNEEAVACLIDALNISDAVLRSRGFTYADCNHRVVFIHEDLSDDEKLMVLAHEEGHIYCRHMNTSPIIGQDVQDEYEANEFAHYLLNPSHPGRVKCILRRHKKAVLISIIGLALLTVAVVALCYTSKRQSYYGEYYITESGNKYHEKDCIFVKDKTNVHRMTEEEFESGEFKPDDEIVVCSECDMPHHKDCWIENQGCTTFGCLGTIKTADNDNSSVTTREMSFEDISPSAGATVYCTKCGAQNESTSLFCSKCGNRLSTSVSAQAPAFQQSDPANTNPYAYVNQQGAAYYQGSNTTSFGYNTAEIDADIQMLIGVKSEYYIPKFQEMRVQNKKNTWNWPAFLIAPYWMIYRKMYAYGAAVLGISFVLSLLGTTIGSLLSLCGYIALGIFGNYIYMNFLEKKATQVKAMNEPYKTQFVMQNSGVNSTAAILTAVGYVLLIIILSL